MSSSITAADYLRRKIYSARVIPIIGDSVVYVLSGTPEQVVARASELCPWGAARLGKTYEIVLQEVQTCTV